MDIEFRNLRYTLGEKAVLKTISGKFLSGELSAILGGSGAGKTSLLNVLAGQTKDGVSGEILLNGKCRTDEIFRKSSCYLMQEDLLRPFFSVSESITISAKLKLGSKFTNAETKVEEIIRLLGLQKCSDTRVELLSGGERKRLSVAMEIVSNPPVLFLDEPITGLDYSTAKNFMQLLKLLTSEGFTIICTVHQPSDLMFRLFDQVYFLSDGWCIYNGETDGLVQFLSEANFPCDSSYSPFDYIIELVYFNEESTSKLKNLIKNGEICVRSRRDDLPKVQQSKLPSSIQDASFWEQSSTLINRTLTQMKRDKILLAIKFFTPIVLGIIVGLLFQDVGNNGDKLIENINLLTTFIPHHIYQQCIPQALLFPYEIKLFRREFSNRWYSLNAYYFALSITSSVSTVIMALLYAIPIYVLTDQPLEVNRFLPYVLSNILLAMTSLPLGLAIGALLTPATGAIFASLFIAYQFLMAICDMGNFGDVNFFKRVAMTCSFARQAFEAFAIGLFQDRKLLSCEKDFCYFRDPEVGLELFGLKEKKFYVPVLWMILIMIVHMICVYVFLRFKSVAARSSRLFTYFK